MEKKKAEVAVVANKGGGLCPVYKLDFLLHGWHVADHISGSDPWLPGIKANY